MDSDMPPARDTLGRPTHTPHLGNKGCLDWQGPGGQNKGSLAPGLGLAQKGTAGCGIQNETGPGPVDRGLGALQKKESPAHTPYTTHHPSPV